MKTTIAFFLLALVSLAQAADNNYYPQAFMDVLGSKKVTNELLKEEINKVLTSTHQKNKNGKDTLDCETAGVASCYEHRVLGYSGARKVLFGKLHVEQNNGQYFIKDVYCHKIFAANAGVKPGSIPNNNVINCEHTWPQSKFSRLYPNEMQKSDLHHLYPTDSKANSVRGNMDFADIQTGNGALDDNNCVASKSGTPAEGGGDDLFEPPTGHKGNVARALFYFSIKYKIKIPANEEPVLRRWNEADPVDDAEMTRNEEIFFAQGSRNPFIDFPNLANYINKF